METAILICFFVLLTYAFLAAIVSDWHESESHLNVGRKGVSYSVYKNLLTELEKPLTESQVQKIMAPICKKMHITGELKNLIENMIVTE